jgi:dipeptidyl-peptidase-4
VAAIHAATPNQPVSPTATGKSLTLEVLYNTPSIIGTAPENYAWSPDSKQLAFLWDDSGSNIRDVWVYSIANGQNAD